MPEPRRNISIRLQPAAVAEIEQIARNEQRTRGDMIRVLLTNAVADYKRKRGTS